ncbi:MAG: DMT family transporter [Candidatus Liptonbacteria bacterium]|nr:DMT family transporter [Candidatus Liptonbacteria bacterium]
MGILFAFGALFSWGIGDFLIQRSVRKFGNGVVLFTITTFGALVLAPFALPDLGSVFTNRNNLLLLLTTSVILLFAAIFDFQALKVGKISVIEPVFAMEIPLAATLAAVFLREFPSGPQLLSILVAFLGIFLVSLKSLRHLRQIRPERGVLLALLATLGMGIINFLFGLAGRETSPIMINWFTDVFLALATGIYLLSTGEYKKLLPDWRANKKLILGVSVLDKAAWLTYTYSMLYIPIAIATTVSESYIALGAILGLWLNREKLKPHQFAGIALAVLGAVALAAVTS